MTSASLKKSWITRCLAPFRYRGAIRNRPVARFRPRLEALDDRIVPSLTVSLTGTTVTLDETAGLQNDDTSAALPAAFSTRLTTLDAAPATAINAAVSNGNVISISGVTGTITNLAFTDASGTVLAGAPSGISTTAGEAISLFTDAVDDNILLGKTSAGAIAFAVYLEETGAPVSGGKFWSIEYKALSHPDATNPDDSVSLPTNVKVSATQEINFGFAGAPSGSNLFMTFGDPTSTQIVVIGKDPLNQSQGGNITTKDVLNISQAGSTTSFGVNGNQINATEGAFITYVSGTNTNFLVPNLDQNEADVEANIAFQNVVDATSASFTVNQTNPGVGPVTVKITAFNTAAEPGVNFVDGLTNDTKVNITSASVVDFVVKSGKTKFTPVVTVNADGTLTVTGLSTGDQVRWTTSGTHNRVLIENISNADADPSNDNNTLDIGGFGISTPNAASAVVGPAVHFEDDGPSVTLTLNGTPALTVDETTLGTPASAPAATLFTTSANFGADGAAVASSSVWSLAVGSGADSGLDDVATGADVLLFLEGGAVVGRVGSASGAVAFTVSINPASGAVTLTQTRALKHPDATNPDDVLTMASGLISVKRAVTDGDGDQDAKSTSISQILTFKDDGPSVSLTGATAPSLTVDETNLAADDTKSFAGQFSALGGADGLTAAGLAYTLSVTAGSTGLVDTATGQAVVLSVNAGVIEGRTATSNALVFTVSVDGSGNVTLDQKRAVAHPDATNPDDSVTLSAAGLVKLTATATDRDGDTAAATLNIGQLLNFEDDGPSIAVNDAAGTFGLGAQGTWSDLPGADGFKSLSLTLNSYSIDGASAVTVNTSLGTVTTVDANGNYVFTGSITADFTNDGIANAQTVNFKLTFNPNDGSYTLQLTTPPSTVSTFDTTQGSLKAGGPDAVQTLLFGGSESGADDIVFFAVVPTAPTSGVAGSSPPNDILDLVVSGATDLTESQIEGLFPIPTLINSSTQMNVSTSGIGVNNNNLDGDSNPAITSGDESFVVNPEAVVDTVTVFIDNSVGGYNPATEDLYYTVYYTDGTVSAPIKVTAAMLKAVTTGVAAGGASFTIDGGDKQIDAVQLTMGRGTVKIPVIQFSVEQVFAPQPLNLNFTATLTDGDADSHQDTFAIALS